MYFDFSHEVVIDLMMHYKSETYVSIRPERFMESFGNCALDKSIYKRITKVRLECYF